MNKLEYLNYMEQMYLGSILNDTTLMEEAKLSSHHFINLYHKELFKIFLELKKEKKPISLIELAGIGESKQITFGGITYLSQLLNSVPSTHTFKTYEQGIIDYHTIQKAQTLSSSFLDRTRETHNADELTTFIQNINHLETELVKPTLTFKQMLEKRVEHHKSTPEKGLSGIDTGFLNLNLLTDGWQPSDLIILGARPSMGKTAFALNGIINGHKKTNDQFTTKFSIEMIGEQIIDRMIAIEGGINLTKMRNPNKGFLERDWESHSKAVAELKEFGVDIRSENNVPDMRAILRKNMRDYPDHKHQVVIDFLTMIKPVSSKASRHQEVEDIVLDLKQMAKDFKVPVIVLAQLTREVEKRQDKRPTLADLRESGSIEQTADVVAFLYRDDYYNAKSKTPGVTELLIEKHRNGKIGILKFNFMKAINRFTEIIQ